MIRMYLRERLSWIILFFALQLLSLIVAYLDPTITIRPILYIVFLSTVVMIVFVAVRYQKETAFFKQLAQWEADFDDNDLLEAASPFEKIIKSRIITQTDKYRRDITDNQTVMEQKQDELTSWIHDVKTPLTAIKLIIDRVDDPKTKQQMTYEWLRIHLLVDQQMHQSRIPTIENDLFVEQTALEPLIFQEIKDVQSWCISKGIGIDVSLEVEQVLTDAKWLSFIIRQILTNAIKYSDQDDIIITSYTSGKQTVLAIQDYGRGIAAKDLPRIYEHGFTSTVSHRDTASSGMGLYLVQRVATSLKIEIDVQSTIGEGSTFTLTFPRENEFVKITSM